MLQRRRRAAVASPAFVAVLLLAAAPARPATAETVARWIELAPGSTPATLAAGRWGDAPLSLTPTILARAIVTGGACPVARVDHALAVPLRRRFDAATLTDLGGTPGSPNGRPLYPAGFVHETAPGTFADGSPRATTSWTECEAVLPAGHRDAVVDGVDLRLPVASPDRILVMADTGCRMNGNAQQDCGSPTAFPWRFLAAYEASFRPDLVVQVGDWFYRDSDCRNAFPGCNDPASPSYETWGDTFDSWNADVFFPAAPLLAAAPWIMLRGNHESCGRGARGWYALLDPFPYDRAKVACAPSMPGPPVAGVAQHGVDFEPTWIAPAGGVDFIVHDSSRAGDTAVASDLARDYDADLTAALAATGPHTVDIFATHKPSFGLVYGKTGGTTAGAARPADDAGDFTEQAVFSGGTYAASAFRHGVPPAIGLFLSGHIHQFEYVDFSDSARFAPQLIVGTGGSLLDPDIATGIVPRGRADPAAFAQQDAAFDVNGFDGKVATVTARHTYARDAFGFALLTARRDRTGTLVGYEAAIYTSSATRQGSCSIRLRPKRGIACDF